MELSAEAKEARRQYSRQWYANNRDKARAAQQRYWQRVADRQKAEHEEKEGD